MVDDSSKPILELLINEELVEKDQDESTVLSQYEVDALLRAVSGDPCHLTLVYSVGPYSHLAKSVKRRLFMNLISVFNLPVKSFEQYEYIINRPARSAEEFSEFVIRTLRR